MSLLNDEQTIELESLLYNISEDLLCIMEDRNITIEQLSDKTNISIDILKNILQGNAYGIKLSHLVNLANAVQGTIQIKLLPRESFI